MKRKICILLFLIVSFLSVPVFAAKLTEEQKADIKNLVLEHLTYNMGENFYYLLFDAEERTIQFDLEPTSKGVTITIVVLLLHGNISYYVHTDLTEQPPNPSNVEYHDTIPLEQVTAPIFAATTQLCDCGTTNETATE